MVPRVGWIPTNGQPYGGLPVTLRVRQVVQPRGGWLPVGCLARRFLGDPMTLRPRENRSPAAVGLAVDYLTRLMCGDDPRDAFQVSVAGAVEVGMDGDALTLLERIHGLDDASVRSALDLVRYDQTVRRGSPAPPPPPVFTGGRGRLLEREAHGAAFLPFPRGGRSGHLAGLHVRWRVYGRGVVR